MPTLDDYNDEIDAMLDVASQGDIMARVRERYLLAETSFALLTDHPYPMMRDDDGFTEAAVGHNLSEIEANWALLKAWLDTPETAYLEVAFLVQQMKDLSDADDYGGFIEKLFLLYKVCRVSTGIL